MFVSCVCVCVRARVCLLMRVFRNAFYLFVYLCVRLCVCFVVCEFVCLVGRGCLCERVV